MKEKNFNTVINVMSEMRKRHKIKIIRCKTVIKIKKAYAQEYFWKRKGIGY